MFRTLLYKTYRQVEFMAFVTIITGLVWLYAEAGNVTTHDAVFDVEFVGPAGKQLAIDPAGLPSVHMQCRCATDKWDPFKTILQKPVKIVVVDNPAEPRQTLVLKDKLQALLPGLNITQVDPQSASVVVEALMPVTFKIKLVLPDNPDIVVSPPDLPPVTGSLPASVKVPADPVIIGRLDPNQLNNLKVNDSALVDIAFSIPDWARAAKDLVIAPAKATVTLKNPIAATVPMSLSVRIDALPQDLKAYDFVVGDGGYVRNITFTGPKVVIDDIKSGKIKVWADLELDQKDIEDALKNPGGSGGSKTPIIRAPQNVTFNIPTPVTFTVTPRKQP